MSELFVFNCVENWQFLFKFRLFQFASLSADDLLLMLIKCDQYCFQPQSTEKKTFPQHKLNSIGLGEWKNTQIPIKILIEIESLLNNTRLASTGSHNTIVGVEVIPWPSRNSHSHSIAVRGYHFHWITEKKNSQSATEQSRTDCSFIPSQ